jgi:hypothetical protein
MLHLKFRVRILHAECLQFAGEYVAHRNNEAGKDPSTDLLENGKDLICSGPIAIFVSLPGKQNVSDNHNGRSP